MNPEVFRTLLERVCLAPSVHNTQPARWRLDGDAVYLFEDLNVRLPAADPSGHDAAISLGAAYEGLVLAAGEVGLAAHSMDADQSGSPDLRPVKKVTFAHRAEPDPLSAHVEARESWRGAFASASEEDRLVARDLEAEDCALIHDPAVINRVSDLLDTASFGYIERRDFRSELLSWMRLRRGHPNWGTDGLNADALHLGRLERLGAAVVMGPAFAALNAVGMAKPLLSEAAKTKSAAAIMLFHRPTKEPHFDSGRAFYRAWLRIEAAGFGAAVLAALADDPDAARAVAEMADLPNDRRIVSAFRIGRRPPHLTTPRARRLVDDLLV